MVIDATDLLIFFTLLPPSQRAVAAVPTLQRRHNPSQHGVDALAWCPKTEGADSSIYSARVSIKNGWKEPHRADAAGHRLRASACPAVSARFYQRRGCGGGRSTGQQRPV